MKDVTVQLITSQGNEKKILSVKDAITFVKDQVNNHNKWIYIDSELKNIEMLEPEDFEEATDILLLSRLAGGNYERN